MISKFTDIGITEDLAKAMDKMGWEEPTPIQQQAVPLGMKGTDMFAQAQTGTGKTGAFGAIVLGRIPAGQRIPSAIIVVPTRELANQVADEFARMSLFSGHVTVPIYGGASIEGQMKKLEAGAAPIVRADGASGLGTRICAL